MSDEDLYAEKRQCNTCGEAWVDGGDDRCPHCASTDTGILATSCRECDGSGHDPHDDGRLCRECGGTGFADEDTP